MDVMLQFDADHHPESRPRLAWSYWLAILKNSIVNLDLILTISEFSKRAILDFAQRYHLNCPPIIVTYLGVEISGSEHGDAPVKEDYVLHLANKLPYKGTAWLLKQWSLLGERMPDLPMLQLVGELDEPAQRTFSTMKGVRLLPPLPRLELEQLIAKSRALLLPSEIEGFGIPAVEAYLLGTPVAFAKDTALEEVVGGGTPGGFYRDNESFYAALEEVLTMAPAAVNAKAADMKSRFNWNDCVRRTLQAYRSVLEQ